MVSKGKETLSTLQGEIKALNEEVKQLKSKLSLSHSAFLNIVGKSLDGVIIIDQKKMVVYTNYAAIRLFDRNIADLLGEPLDLDFNPMSLVNSDETTTEIHIPKADGSEVITEVSVLKTEWNNEPCYVVSFRDITERKKTEEMLEYMSTHDYLTKLHNRVNLEQRINKAIEDAKARHQHMALVYVDLDNFKTINDTLGHEIGDLLLKEVSATLQNNIRYGDSVTRLGGDEFVIILTSLRKPTYAASVSHTILDKLNRVFHLDGREVYINASIGIAVYPGGGTTAVELLKNADTAMYVSKSRGKNQYRFFSEELNQQKEQNLLIVNGLRHALHNQELFLQYQPIIDIKNMTCCGMEALLRWRHPQLGIMLPDQFIYCAEALGAMSMIGKWVLAQALDDYAKFHANSSLYLSMNMSADEFMAIGLVDSILAALDERHIPPRNFIVELTETVIIEHPELIIKKFNRLADYGIRIAIDDYGTGYSSLSLLKQLPLSIMKIDKYFIEDLDKNYNNTVIIESTIQLAHGLNLKVIAEGVETMAQFEFLKECGCDYAQGNYFSKPLDSDELVTFIATF